MINYYVLDTETTGLSSDYHEVTQISIIRCTDRNQINRYIKADFPERASQAALDVTGRTRADLNMGESREMVINAINNFLDKDSGDPENRCIIAHNAEFDKRFCHALWGKADKIFPANLWLCTKSYTKSFTVKNAIAKPSLTLESSLKIIGAKAIPAFHNAVTDARNTYILWTKLQEHGIDPLDHIRRMPHSNDKEV